MATLRLGSRTLEYFEAGAGPRQVVLLHGSNSSARVWDALQRQLASAGVHTYALSSCGAGASDAPDDAAAYTPLEYARDTMSAAEVLGLSTFTLVAHSLGTIAARYVMRDHPERVRALVLISGPDPSEQTVTRPQSNPKAPPSEEWKRQHAGLSADAIAALIADRQNNPPQRQVGQAPPWPGLEGLAAAISVPTLVMLGDADQVVEPARALAGYLELSPRVRHLQVFHGAGHSPQAQIPDEVASTLLRFMDTFDPDRRPDTSPGGRI